jgi:hypothetical protein
MPSSTIPRDLRRPAARPSNRETFDCPICGFDEPHGHDEDVIAAWRADQIRADGWTSAIVRLPQKDGDYLGYGHKVPMGVVRENAELFQSRRTFGTFLEVLEFRPAYGFSLKSMPFFGRILQGRTIFVHPRFWRPVSLPPRC